MSAQGKSQCYFIQLQIDSFLDGELAVAAREAFVGHVTACESCGRALRLAQHTHDTLLDLPALDCGDEVLAVVHERVAEAAAAGAKDGKPRQAAPFPWASLAAWFGTLPAAARVALPTGAAAGLALVAILVMPVGGRQGPPIPGSVPLAGGTAAEGPLLVVANGATTAAGEVMYTPAELAAALRELNLAIDYLGAASERAKYLIGNRFLIAPLQESLNASFGSIEREADGPAPDDPI